MKIKNNDIIVDVEGGILTSLKYKEKEILYQGDQGWKKTFPICFPVVGFSDAFEVNGKDYKLPKHGFWNNLEWESFDENGSLVSVATVFADDKFPFTLDINMKVTIEGNVISITTQITNVSKEEAYFHFGYHPAFKIDNLSKLIIDSDKDPRIIDLDGHLEDKTVKMEELMSMRFEKDYDTLVYKDVDFDSVSFKANDVEVKINHNANNLQIWKKSEDSFVCIEPWYGSGDRETQLIKEAKKKKEINSISSGKTWTAKMNIFLK